MNLTIRHISRTSLNEEAYRKLLKKYFSKLKNDTILSFDLRIKDFGYYIYDLSNEIHHIKLSPILNSYNDNGIKLDEGAEKYNLISSTLHEFFHATQKEELGKDFFSKKFGCAKDIENPDAADFYSTCEVEARSFENKNILEAVSFYNLCCKDI